MNAPETSEVTQDFRSLKTKLRALLDWLPQLIARVPTNVHTKLLAAFLAIVVLLIAVGAVGLNALSEANRRTEELVALQQKIAAYRQLQNDTTEQLLNVSSALVSPDARTLDSTLRQLNQFGYDLDRLQFVSKGEEELFAQIQQDYKEFIQTVTEVVGLIRVGKVVEGKELNAKTAPLADRLERRTNQLVNRAQAEIVAKTDQDREAYQSSIGVVIGFGVGSIALALILGYAISWSLVAPVRRMNARLDEIGAGDFSRHVQVSNRDELGSLATNLNRMNDELGRLYEEKESRNRDLTELLEQQTATSEILRVIASSPTNVQPVVDVIVEQAARLCQSDHATIRLVEGEVLRSVSSFGLVVGRNADDYLIPLNRGALTGRAVIDQKTLHVHDVAADTGNEFAAVQSITRARGVRTALAVPLMRENFPIGAILIYRKEVRPYTEKQIALLETFAAQAVIAIENVRLFHELQEKTAQLEIASRHKSEFLSNMSHELRTPLNAINGFSEVLLEKLFGELNPRQEDYLKDILSSGRHLLLLINDILDLSKVEAGRMELELTQFDLREALQNGLTMMKERASRHNVELTLEIEDGIPAIQADERKIKQTVFNFLSNAVKFTPDGGKVGIQAARANGAVCITVWDTGVGISPEDQKLLFEEFRQVGNATQKREGTGLGLAVSKKIIELHGGRVWVESQVGEGSRFSFTIPITRTGN